MNGMKRKAAAEALKAVADTDDGVVADSSANMDAVIASMLVPVAPTGAAAPSSSAAPLSADGATPAGSGAVPAAPAGDDTPIVDDNEDAGDPEGGDDFDDYDNFFADSPSNDDGDGAAAPIELADDMLVSVTVDGEEKQVTLAELRRNYSGEGAIERRIQEASEKKNAAEAALAEAHEFARSERAKIANAMKALETVLLTPKAKMPDPRLADTDPGKYAAAMLQYQQDQQRLSMMRATIDGAMQKVEQDKVEVSEQTKMAEAQKLLNAIPALKDVKRAPKVQAAIVAAAKDHGFSDAEIAGVVDHRLYVLALKAGLYDKMRASKGLHPEVQKKLQRTMPSGNGRTVSARTHQQRDAFAKAQRTGSVEDVAATMIAPAKRR